MGTSPDSLPYLLLHATGDHAMAAFAELSTARSVNEFLRNRWHECGADINLEPWEYEVIDLRTGRPPSIGSGSF